MNRASRGREEEQVRSGVGGAGGGIRIAEDGEGVIVSSQITGNSAETGAGIYTEGALTQTAVTFTDHDASSKGGGVAVLDSHVTATGCSFSANEGLLGGGLSLEQSTADIDTTGFTSNQAYHGGGGYLTSDSNAALLEVTFEGNYAITEGGGLYLTSSSLMTAEVCSFSENDPDDFYRVGLGAIDWGLAASFVCDEDGCTQDPAPFFSPITMGGAATKGLISDGANATIWMKYHS